jgi:hypothetical protein
MTEERPRRPWGLVGGTVAFLVLAPPSLAGLPFVALTLAARPRSGLAWFSVTLVGMVSLWLLVTPSPDVVAGFVNAYAVLVSAAFLGLVLFAPARGLLGRALVASLAAGTATAALARLVLGASAFGALQWSVTRQASATIRAVLAREPELFTVFEPVVRFFSHTLPAIVVLESLAGLALAWQWYHRIAARPRGTPLAPFRQFRFSDYWVWGIVGALVVWVTPGLAGLKIAALNLLLVLGVLYVIRGLAIVLTFTAAWSVAPVAVIAGAVVVAAFALPLLVVVATLGISDTWIEFRRRLKTPA